MNNLQFGLLTLLLISITFLAIIGLVILMKFAPIIAIPIVVIIISYWFGWIINQGMNHG